MLITWLICIYYIVQEQIVTECVFVVMYVYHNDFCIIVCFVLHIMPRMKWLASIGIYDSGTRKICGIIYLGRKVIILAPGGHDCQLRGQRTPSTQDL